MLFETIWCIVHSLNNIFGLLTFLRHPPLGVIGGAQLWRKQYRKPILSGDTDATQKLAGIIAEVSGHDCGKPLCVVEVVVGVRCVVMSQETLVENGVSSTAFEQSLW